MRELATFLWKCVLWILLTYAATKLFKPMKHADVLTTAGCSRLYQASCLVLFWLQYLYLVVQTAIRKEQLMPLSKTTCYQLW